MLPTTELNRIKGQISIADFLASRGIQPVSQAAGELAYCSPLRGDSKPSFYVNLPKNVFKDMVVEHHRGDVIRLVELLDGVSFATAIQTLQAFEGQAPPPRFFLSGSSPTTAKGQEQIREIKLLQTPSLLRYVDSRSIGISTARTYLREVHYGHNGRYLYALGFPNDNGGYALRNGVGCKRNIGPTGISTLPGARPKSLTANVFEGMFDFLSALDYYQLRTPTFPTYVLNSVSNLAQLPLGLSAYRRINVYFDRDKAGRSALATLQGHELPVFDQSVLYQGHNDFNDFYAQLKKANR